MITRRKFKQQQPQQTLVIGVFESEKKNRADTTIISARNTSRLSSNHENHTLCLLLASMRDPSLLRRRF